MTAPLPTVSVLTPSFNQAAYLGATINSVLRQGYPALDYHIIDGGSTDGSMDVIASYRDRLASAVSEPDRGQSHAFNKGLARAAGSIIGWLNSDDLYLGSCIDEAVRFFTDHPDIDIVFADYIFIDAQGRLLKRRREPCFDQATYLWTGDCYHANCAGFFRRRVFDRIGGLDESLHHGMDFEFYLRAAAAGLRVGHVHSFWGAYRLHEASKTLTAGDVRTRDAREILARYRPAGISAVGARLRFGLYDLQRRARKAALMLNRTPPEWPV